MWIDDAKSHGSNLESETLGAVRRLLTSAAFVRWHGSYLAIQRQIMTARARHEDPLTTTLLRIGECEDRAAAARQEVARLDASFEAISAYTQKCEETTTAWQELQASELAIESRLNADQPESRLTGVLRAGTIRALQQMKSETAAHKQRFMNETWQLESRWRDVVQSWRQRERAALARAEHAYEARRLRRLLEVLEVMTGAPVQLTKREECLEARVESLAAQLEATIKEAEASFGCILIAGFCYWRKAGASKRVLCVPLLDEPAPLHSSIHALGVYDLDATTGLDAIATPRLGRSNARPHRTVTLRHDARLGRDALTA